MYTSYTEEKGLHKAAPTKVNDLHSQYSKKDQKKPVKLTKTNRVLMALIKRSYNRFEAARKLHDWCLHSTVATIQAKGIEVLRKYETVPGYNGTPTKCCRYWISEDQHEKANNLLGLR